MENKAGTEYLRKFLILPFVFILSFEAGISQVGRSKHRLKWQLFCTLLYIEKLDTHQYLNSFKNFGHFNELKKRGGMYRFLNVYVLYCFLLSS